MNDNKREEFDAVKSAAVIDATNIVMKQVVDLLMKEYGVDDHRTKGFCETQVFNGLWRALNEAEWAIHNRANV
jgi:hypothetical protein